jgi:hypothetical protein
MISARASGDQNWVIPNKCETNAVITLTVYLKSLTTCYRQSVSDHIMMIQCVIGPSSSG